MSAANRKFAKKYFLRLVACPSLVFIIVHNYFTLQKSHYTLGLLSKQSKRAYEVVVSLR